MNFLKARVPLPLAIAAGVLIVAITSVAYATIPANDGTITGCYKTVNGDLRVIDNGAGQACHQDEQTLTWNQTGPTGPTGTTPALTITRVKNSLIANAGLAQVNATCPAGYELTGGASGTDSQSQLVSEGPGADFGQPVSAQTWTVIYYVDANGIEIDSEAICLKTS
jgi:hypothetical protein